MTPKFGAWCGGRSFISCRERKHELAVNFQSKLNFFSKHWSPKVIADMNDYQFKLVKTQGEFTCYHYSDTDKTFIVLEGSMCSESEDRIAYLSKREMFVVRKG